MALTKIQIKNHQRAITQKIKVAELCTAFLHNVFYQCMKFPIESFNSLDDIAQTKIKCENNRQKLHACENNKGHILEKKGDIVVFFVK